MNDQDPQLLRGILYALPIALAFWAAVAVAVTVATR